MKSLVTASILAVCLALTVGCAKKTAEKKNISSEEVGKALATTLCDKYVACQPSPDFNKEQCLQEIMSGLTERLKTKTDLKLEQSSVDGCTKSITAADCEILNSEAPPQGCEFLN